MKKVMNWMMLSCKSASALVDKKASVGLSNWEKFRLWMHITVCGGCTRYESQSTFIDEAIDKLVSEVDSKTSTVDDKNTQVLEKRILEEIDG